METLEYIEAYFQKSISEAERKGFEKRCETDNAFAEEVAFYVTSRQAIREQLLQQKQWQWKDENINEENVPSIPSAKNLFIHKWLLYAAAACILLIISVIYFERTQSPQQLASDYVKQNFSQLSQTMDGGKDSLQQGIAEYNNKQFDKALQLFEAVSSMHPENSDAKKYAGLVYLQAKNYDKALNKFDELANMEGLFSNPGRFLKAVALIERNKQGDKEQAKQLLQQVINEKSEESKKAQEWMNKF